MTTHTITDKQMQNHQKNVTDVNQQPVWEKDAEFNRFGIISMILIIVGCLGGITVGMGAIQYIWSLILVVIPTMTSLSLVLALAPMRYIFYATVASILIDIILLAYFLIV